jgi:hypothetical protein
MYHYTTPDSQCHNFYCRVFTFTNGPIQCECFCLLSLSLILERCIYTMITNSSFFCIFDCTRDWSCANIQVHNCTFFLCAKFYFVYRFLFLLNNFPEVELLDYFLSFDKVYPTLFFFSPGVESKAQQVVGEYCTTELYPQLCPTVRSQRYYSEFSSANFILLPFLFRSLIPTSTWHKVGFYFLFPSKK